ncbi:MAG: endopeptidase La, partial [Muribaculaceae bacterium]|nr:endopeptidase La [Muribaculaceae bacterium]
LFIETSLSPAKEPKLTLIGSLGDVMKESAVIARQYILEHAEEMGIDRAKIDSQAVHIHVPEGATPKDGPSAGITMLTSMVSAYTGRPVKPGIAMTGEMTLRGKVLPVGGIKEKLLAARRAGRKTIILSAENRKDVEEIKKEYLDDLTIKFVDKAGEVIAAALMD